MLEPNEKRRRRHWSAALRISSIGTFQQSECLRPKFLEPVETAFLELIHFVEIDGRRLLAAQAELQTAETAALARRGFERERFSAARRKRPVFGGFAQHELRVVILQNFGDKGISRNSR